MLKKENIDHILRAAAAITNRTRFVMVGTGAVIAMARPIPLQTMLTPEIDIYVEGPDADLVSDQIDAAIGQGSMFHRTWHYDGDGVGPGTAIMPLDWKTRASVYATPDGRVEALCPSADDIAIAKLCAGRDKDRAWLRAALQSGLARAGTMRDLIEAGLPPAAPATEHLLLQLSYLVP